MVELTFRSEYKFDFIQQDPVRKTSTCAEDLLGKSINVLLIFQSVPFLLIRLHTQNHFCLATGLKSSLKGSVKTLKLVEEDFVEYLFSFSRGPVL